MKRIVLTVLLLVVSAVQAAEPTPSEILASVRVGAGGGCSGTIIVRGDEVAYGISAAHCGAVVDQETKIGFVDGTTGSARWKVVDQKRDLALFVCWSADVLAIAPVPDAIIRDAALSGVGFPSNQGPKKVDLIYQREANIGGGVTPRCEFSVVSGPYGSGASGGGVFRDGCLVSVFSHQNSTQVAYGCRHEDLIGFLQENKSAVREGVLAVKCLDGKCPKDSNGRWTPSPNIKITLPDDEGKRGNTVLKDSAATKHILELEKRVTDLEARLAKLEKGSNDVAPPPPIEPNKDAPPVPREGAIGATGPRGEKGEAGPAGKDGVVTLVLKWDDGSPIKTISNLLAGTKVTLPLKKKISDPK